MNLKFQYAALPYVRQREGLEVLLLTSRETKRWIIPKGWSEAGVAPHKQAAAEAYEEGGLQGSIHKQSVGCYHYDKINKKGVGIPCRVEVFPLLVNFHLLQWPEKQERQLFWTTPHNAADLVDEPELAEIMCSFSP